MKADGLKLAQSAIIDADATPNPGGWPRGGQTIIDIPNNHLSYALTWFGLAVVLLGVYLAYHWSQGRSRPASLDMSRGLVQGPKLPSSWSRPRLRRTAGFEGEGPP